MGWPSDRVDRHAVWMYKGHSFPGGLTVVLPAGSCERRYVGAVVRLPRGFRGISTYIGWCSVHGGRVVG